MQSTPDAFEKARERQEEFRNKTFRMMLEVAVVFAVPAVIAVVVGKRLDTGSSSQWLVVCLAVAFIFSWSIVIRMYTKLSREAKEIDALVRAARAQQPPASADKKKQVTDEDDEDKPGSLKSLIM